MNLFGLDVPHWAPAFLVSLAVCALMVRFGPRDAPDGERKTQARAVPSGGGLGIAAGHLVGLFLMVPVARSLLGDGHWLSGGAASLLAWTALAGLVVLAIGYRDDVRAMRPATKLALLMGVSLGVAAGGWPLLAAHFEWLPALSLAAIPLILGGALWLFVVMNATNFMDGSNGLALGCGAIMLAVLGQLFAPVDGLVPAILAFLVLNMAGWLYAGDAGALYVGFWIAALGLMGAFIGHFSIWIPPLIALPFLVDIILTVIWRARRGGNVLQAHREHAYQLLRRAGWGHIHVAWLWWAMSAVCGGLAIWAVHADTTGSGLQQPLAFLGALAILSALWTWQRAAYWPRVSAPG